MNLKRLCIVLSLIFWPVSLLLKNIFPDFLKYLIPIFEVKLLILPAVFFIINKKFKLAIVFIIIFLLFFRSWWGQTIFKPDYEAQQLVVRQTLLYPNPILARAFHNKARVVLDKFNNNFFALTDPNNYFFRFSPRQIAVDNQNLKKFPSLAIIPTLVGFYFFRKHRHKKLILTYLLSSIISLSLLTVWDRNDFILWFPLGAILIHGSKFIKNKYFWAFYLIFSTLELIQIFYA